MEHNNHIPESNDFQTKIKQIQHYLLELIARKFGRAQSQTQKKVETLLQEDTKNSWIKKLKNMLGFEESATQEHTKEQDEYIPQDMEFGESMGEDQHFAEITPGKTGYYLVGKKSYFDPKTNLWSKHSVWNVPGESILRSQKMVYSGVFPKGRASVALPYGATLDPSSLTYTGSRPPKVFQDQNGMYALECDEKMYVGFSFGIQALTHTPPIVQESERLFFDSGNKEVKKLLSGVQGTPIQKAKILRDRIVTTKKYSTKVQGELHKMSSSKNYFSNIARSPIAECYSANGLFVALCRECMIPARLCVGYHVSKLTPDGKSFLSNQHGHAWSEVWDEESQKRHIFDATPTQKEDGSESNENSQSSDAGDDSQGSNQSPTSQGDASKPTTPSSSGAPIPSPEQSLQDVLEKAKNDSLSKQAETLKDTLDQLAGAPDKQTLDTLAKTSKLEDFAKELIDELVEQEIFNQEEKEVKEAQSEEALDTILQEALSRGESLQTLRTKAQIQREKIRQERARLRQEMKQSGFEEEEEALYKEFLKLKEEVTPEIRKHIRLLEKILPKEYHLVVNTDEYFLSGTQLGNTGKLIEYQLFGDPKVMRRQKEVPSVKVNMYETILIDRSGSMGSFDTPGSALRQAVKASIIRAGVLEHFHVDFQIIFFDTEVEMVMDYGEKYTSKRPNPIPARLMRAVKKSGGTNIEAPLTLALDSLKRQSQKTGKKSYGTVFFLGDGEPTHGMKSSELKVLVDTIEKSGFALSAYHIEDTHQAENSLGKIFGKNTIVVPRVADLSEKLIEHYNTQLKKKFRHSTNTF